MEKHTITTWLFFGVNKSRWQQMINKLSTQIACIRSSSSVESVVCNTHLPFTNDISHWCHRSSSVWGDNTDIYLGQKQGKHKICSVRHVLPSALNATITGIIVSEDGKEGLWRMHVRYVHPSSELSCISCDDEWWTDVSALKDIVVTFFICVMEKKLSSLVEVRCAQQPLLLPVHGIWLFWPQAYLCGFPQFAKGMAVPHLAFHQHRHMADQMQKHNLLDPRGACHLKSHHGRRCQGWCKRVL